MIYTICILIDGKQKKSNSLLKWVKAFKLILLVKPLSDASERVFSLLNNSFNPRQEAALEDHIHLSVMMQYNNRKSK